MKTVTSRDNAFFKQIKKLAQSGRERQQNALTLLDGLHLIEAYENAIGSVKHLICSMSSMGRPEIAARIEHGSAFVFSDALFQDAGIVDSPTGLMAVIDLPSAEPPNLSVDTLVLDGVQDPGNLGTLLRTAAAAGFTQAICASDCASPWSPRVLRAGQGAHFSLNIIEGQGLHEFLAAYRGTVAVTHLHGDVSLYAANLSGPVAWVFGSEGQGVRAAHLALATQKIKIPMPGPAESLNVGAAAAICLFETLRQRSVRSV